MFIKIIQKLPSRISWNLIERSTVVKEKGITFLHLNLDHFLKWGNCADKCSLNELRSYTEKLKQSKGKNLS